MCVCTDEETDNVSLLHTVKRKIELKLEKSSLLYTVWVYMNKRRNLRSHGTYNCVKPCVHNSSPCVLWRLVHCNSPYALCMFSTVYGYEGRLLFNIMIVRLYIYVNKIHYKTIIWFRLVFIGIYNNELFAFSNFIQLY